MTWKRFDKVGVTVGVPVRVEGRDYYNDSIIRATVRYEKYDTPEKPSFAFCKFKSVHFWKPATATQYRVFNARAVKAFGTLYSMPSIEQRV